MSEYKVSFVRGSLLNNNNCIKHGSDAVMIDENDMGIYIGNNTNNPKMVAPGPNSFKTINGESLLGEGNIDTENSYILEFTINDLIDLKEGTISEITFDSEALRNAWVINKKIYIRDTENDTIVLVNTYADEYYSFSFLYKGDLYVIDTEGTTFSADEVWIEGVPNLVHTSDEKVISKSLLTEDLQTKLDMALVNENVYDNNHVIADGIFSSNDFYYSTPDVGSDDAYTLATKSDINASLTKPANYQIWYTTTDASVIEFDDTLFDVQLVSNVYENGRGVITFNGDILSIPAQVFSGKNNLKTIIIPNSVTSIGIEAFSYCSNLTSVTIPDNVTTIGGMAFYNCTSLTSVTIGDSVTEIAHSAFKGCGSLTSVNIPDSVTTIGGGAFMYCDSLTSITIPDSVTEIGNQTFRPCESLTSVYCKATTPPTLSGTTIFDTNTNLKIYVPIESLETYKSEQGWDVYSDKICSILDSNSVKTINGESIIGSGDLQITTGDDNVQADWNVSDTTSDSYIKNRTHYAEFSQVSIPSTINTDSWTQIQLSEISGQTLYVRYSYSPSNIVAATTFSMDELNVERTFNNGPNFTIYRTTNSIFIKGNYDENHILEVATIVNKLPDYFIPSNIARTSELSSKQDTLVSGTNIKTINGTSILGSGNLAISSLTPMTFVSPTSAGTPIPMNTTTVVTSVTSASKTFTLVTTSAVTNPANLRTEQKWSLIFGVSASLSAAPTITFNTGNIGTLYWVNGVAPTFAVGKYYEVSFLNVGGVLLGVCAEFGAAS